MKIVGTSEQGLLIAATPDEITRLIGFYYTGAQGCPSLVVGMEIKVNDMYNQLRDLKSKEDSMRDIAAQLRVCATLIESHDPLFRALAKGESLESNKNQNA